jgi:hypothetical protein
MTCQSGGSGGWSTPGDLDVGSDIGVVAGVYS